MMRVCVIGAGVAGLAAIRRLAATRGLKGIVYEQSGDIGGIWSELENQEECYRTPMYQNLRTNFPKEITQYLDFEFTQGQSSYVYRQEIHSYMKDYVEHFKLRPYIQFRKQVTNVKPNLRDINENSNNSGASWEVTARDNGTGLEETHEFDSVMVCNGHYYKPYIPEISDIDIFRGNVLHSRDYNSSESFANQNVVVIGAGPSAADISVELSKCAKTIARSFRQIPEDESPAAANVVHVGPIKHVESDGFVFDCDQKFRADALLYGTGYLYEFPFLDPSCQVQITEGKMISPLYKHMIHPKFPTLCFICIPSTVLPFTLSDVQARFYVSYLSGKISLPSEGEMLQEQMEDLKKREAKGLPLRYSHQLGNRMWGYFDSLATQAGFSHELKPVFQEIFNHTVKRMKEDRAGYKDDKYNIIDNKTYVTQQSRK